jgi:hypothetical protein
VNARQRFVGPDAQHAHQTPKGGIDVTFWGMGSWQQEPSQLTRPNAGAELNASVRALSGRPTAGVTMSRSATTLRLERRCCNEPCTAVLRSAGLSPHEFAVDETCRYCVIVRTETPRREDHVNRSHKTSFRFNSPSRSVTHRPDDAARHAHQRSEASGGTSGPEPRDWPWAECEREAIGVKTS